MVAFSHRLRARLVLSSFTGISPLSAPVCWSIEPMHLSPRTASLLLALLAAHPAGYAQSKYHLSTSDTSITLAAEPHAPRLLSVSGPTHSQLVNTTPESLPSAVYPTPQPDAAAIPVSWTFDPIHSTISHTQIDLVYRSTSPALILHSLWIARAAFGPIEHTITLESHDSRELWLPLIDSLALSDPDPGTPLHHFSVEKGADSPSAQGTHLADITPGFSWTGYSSTYADYSAKNPREIIPFEILYADSLRQPGFYFGLEFSGRTRIACSRQGAALSTVLGLNPDPGPYRTRLTPGGTFSTPTAFLGAFSGGLDGAGNRLRPWVRQVLGNPLTWRDPHYPYANNNSWGSGMAVDEPLALRMIHDSKELGLEMYHIDAGWFRNVGDWMPDPKKFPHGLAFIADQAHAAGLKFGIWTDWTQAALSTEPNALNIRDPKVVDWMISDLGPDWKPEEFKGQTIDLGVPAAQTWAASELKRIVESYHLDMIEHDGYLLAQGCLRADHPHAPPIASTVKLLHDWGSDFITANNSTDVSDHTVRAYYALYEQLRRTHPGLLFEICNDGGRMVDFGSAAHGDYFSITDTYDPLSNRRAFFDTSYALPAAMLESYVEKWPTPTLGQYRYMLRSGMMGWISIMLDTTIWTPEQHQAAKSEIALYKQQLRPLIRDARLFHVSPRPDGIHWDGIQYYDPARQTGVVFAFRGTIADQPTHTFPLAGLSPTARYRLHFQDASSPDRIATGTELTSGLTVNLRDPLTSELIFLTRIATPAAHSAHAKE